jgi:Concanavalin A-like lectin/glucanases superfamily
MRLPALLRRRGAPIGAAAAVLLLAGLAAAVPGASGGYSARIANSTDTVASAPYFKCVDALAPDSASALFQWSLGDASGATSAADLSGHSNVGTYQGSMVADSGTPMGCPRDPGTAWKLDGTSSFAYFPTQQSSPQTFTLEVDFQTTVNGGRLIGLGSAKTGTSGNYDRQIYITSSGTITFGVYNGGAKLATSSTVVTDGLWHHVAATMSSAGMKLYVDGRLAGTNTNTAGETDNGYWRVGYDSLSGWTGAAAPYYFSGRMRYAAVYTTALTAQQIANHAAPTFGS